MSFKFLTIFFNKSTDVLNVSNDFSEFSDGVIKFSFKILQLLSLPLLI